LSVQNCSYTSLPELPGNLQYLSCMENSLSSLPELPESLLQIHCQNNVLTSLPSLPDGMDLIIAYDNQLTELPPLPSALTYLECYDNLLTSLPELPPLLNNLYCQNNQLMSFPEIPQSMLVLNCTNNQIGCFPPFPNTLASPNIQNNPFTCLPNYIQSMGVMGLLDYPLCEDNDLVNNPFGCASAQGVSGFIYDDANGDCMLTSGETGLPNLTIKLLDDQGNFVSATTSAGNGVYFLSSDTLSYTVKVDTLNKPFQVSCADPGAEQDFDFTIDGQLIADLNFGLECKPGLDIG